MVKKYSSLANNAHGAALKDRRGRSQEEDQRLLHAGVEGRRPAGSCTYTDIVPFWRERHGPDFEIPRWQPFAAKHAAGLEEKAAKYYEAHDARCQSVQDEADALANDVLKPLRET